jgi:spore germination cell wall hydrolase CwlJ-like protein
MTPIPPPRKKARESKRPADRAMMVAIAIVAMIGMILGWIIRDVAGRADAEVAEQTVEQTERIELKRIAPEPVIAQSVVMERTEPEEPEPYYALTEAERAEIEMVVMAEAGGEPYIGQVAVAQCIRDTAIRDKLRPSEVLVEYKYTPTRKEPTQGVQEAVRAVFDDGESAIDTAYYFYAPALVTSKWHEAQEFVAELGGHRFFR